MDVWCDVGRPTQRREGRQLQALHAGIFGQNLSEVLTDRGDDQLVDVEGLRLTGQLQVRQEPAEGGQRSGQCSRIYETYKTLL